MEEQIKETDDKQAKDFLKRLKNNLEYSIGFCQKFQRRVNDIEKVEQKPLTKVRIFLIMSRFETTIM